MLTGAVECWYQIPASVFYAAKDSVVAIALDGGIPNTLKHSGLEFVPTVYQYVFHAGLLLRLYDSVCSARLVHYQELLFFKILMMVKGEKKPYYCDKRRMAFSTRLMHSSFLSK